jgi:protoporphyrinogen IX oxidase
MIDWLVPAYLWLKAFHIIAVVAWMAGLFYLPRLFVYHAEAGPGTAQSETFKVMERRLFRGIMNPALIAVWILGPLLLLSMPEDTMRAGWFHAKLVLVVLLTVFHHRLGRWRKDLEADRSTRSTRFFRLANEVPTVLLVLTVLLVVLKPF